MKLLTTDTIPFVLTIIVVIAIPLAFYIGKKMGEFKEKYNNYFLPYDYTDPKTRIIEQRTRPNSLKNRIKAIVRACFLIYLQAFAATFVIIILPLALCQECSNRNKNYSPSDDIYINEHRPDKY